MDETAIRLKTFADSPEIVFVWTGPKSPPTRYECSSDSYSTIAKNIPQFQATNLLPIGLDPFRLDDGGGIEDTLRKNGAKYHHNCRLMFSNCKLERATKRAAEIQSDPGEGHAKIRRASIEVQLCFLCEKMEPTSELRQAMTMQLNERLNECARNHSEFMRVHHQDHLWALTTYTAISTFKLYN